MASLAPARIAPFTILKLLRNGLTFLFQMLRRGLVLDLSVAGGKSHQTWNIVSCRGANVEVEHRVIGMPGQLEKRAEN